MENTDKNSDFGLLFMCTWVCRYSIKGKNGNSDVVHTLYRGRFHGEAEAWYIKDKNDETTIYELVPIPMYEKQGVTVYRVNDRGKTTHRFTHEKIKRYARRKEMEFRFHREDFVPK